MGDYQGNNAHAASARFQNDVRKPLPVVMLVMGLSGTGKSSFINLATGQTDCPTSTGPRSCTKSLRTYTSSRGINECHIQFIDTPGFANDTFDDRRVLERLVEYCAPFDRHDGSSSFTRRLTGMLYIHSEDEPFKSRTSRKTIEMLVKVLGEQFLDRVTVLIQSQNGAQTDLAKVVQSEDSPLYPLYHSNTKLWATIPFPQDPQSIEQMLKPYTILFPRLVRFDVVQTFFNEREGNIWQYSEIPRHLREFFPDDVGPSIIVNQVDRRQEELERANALLAQKEQDLKDLQFTHENELKVIQEENKAEKAKHELEHSGLRQTIQDQEARLLELQSRKDPGPDESELMKELSSKMNSEIEQLRDELEAKGQELMKAKEDNQRAIRESTKTLQAKDIEITELKNRVNGTANKAAKNQGDDVHYLKAEIRRINAEYGSLRTHMQLEENTEQADIMTALGDINRLIEEFGQTIAEHIEKHMENNPPKKDFRPRDLLSILGRVESKVASKIKHEAYLLLEYVIQAIVCDQLYTHLFKPFHPSISGDRDIFIGQIHGQLAHQAPQTVSGRWRRDAFNSISSITLGGQDKPKGDRMHGLITSALIALLGKFDGIKPEDVLKEHDKALVKLITRAEGLNQLLKGGVSVLGDFQPMAFSFGQAFKPMHMAEVSSKPKKPFVPETILGTVGLGLIKYYASGGNQGPEEAVLRQAIVLGSPK